MIRNSWLIASDWLRNADRVEGIVAQLKAKYNKIAINRSVINKKKKLKRDIIGRKRNQGFKRISPIEEYFTLFDGTDLRWTMEANTTCIPVDAQIRSNPLETESQNQTIRRDRIGPWTVSEWVFTAMARKVLRSSICTKKGGRRCRYKTHSRRHSNFNRWFPWEVNCEGLLK